MDLRYPLIVAAVAWCTSVALATPQVETFVRSAHLGETSLHLSASSTELSSTPENERFRVSGTLTIDNPGMSSFSANPWTLAQVGANAQGIVEGFTGVGLSNAYLARLAGNPQADLVLISIGCGANCSSGSTFLTYDASRGTYVRAIWAYAPDWDTVGSGHLLHLDATHDAIATTQPSPFDDCHACLPGTVPVLYAIAGGKIVDVSARLPARLRADAGAAWISFSAVRGSDDDAIMDRNVALFRYLADECRLGACATAWQRVKAAIHGNDTKDILAQFRSGIASRGYGNL